MNSSKFSSQISSQISANVSGKLIGGLAAIATLAIATPALAHHPFGGQAPKTILEGLISGVGHPVLGFDHFAFVLAVGFLAAVLYRGVTVPLAFLLAALTGTGVHLLEATLPAPELIISASVLLFGLLAVGHNKLNTQAVILLTALAGLFHGYAYGEAIVGAEPTPLVAYLVGFTAVQSAIALFAYLLARKTTETYQNSQATAGILDVKKAGLVICGAGVVLLGNLLV